MRLDSDVIELNSIGEQRAKKLHIIGIDTVKDLIEHFPRDYDDRSHIKKIKELSVNEENTFLAKIEGSGENIRIQNKILTRVKLKDDTAVITALWYNQPYRKTALELRAEYLFTGKVQKKYSKLEVISPEFEKVSENELLSGGRIIPIYATTAGMSQKILRTLIKTTLESTKNQLADFIPMWIRKKYQLCDRNFAIENIHFPESNDSFFIARKRLVFEELFLLQTALFQIKAALNTGKKGIKFQKIEVYQKLIAVLPFSLTNAQKKVLEEIKQDMTNGKIMNRLVQGDVGSGKTAVAMLSAFIAIQNGCQAALMAPTEVLAQQHYEAFSALFCQFGIKTVLLTGSLTKKEKEKVLFDICTGEAQMILGTHAVIQKNVVFQKLGLVITDEQHRFGVRQRAVLSEKGNNPHVLVMTATPIPRTLALILYGDLDISIIDELPPGRQTIDTRAVPPSYHERIYTFIKKELEQGQQAYIICPMIEENEKLELQSVLNYHEKISKTVFQNYQTACLHGKMKPKEKQTIMEAFAKGEIHILVSTTVIEVGINVPNATIMLIENAERFGLAQLHQLRGRVGRGSKQSYCILVCDSKNKIAAERMNVMKKTADGFQISEMDLKLRGPGEFFGTRQHGLPELKIANLYKDIQLLKQSQEAAELLLQKDENLEEEPHFLLKKELKLFFTKETIPI